MACRPAPAFLRSNPVGFHFGLIGEGRTVRANLRLNNTTSEPLTIETIATSCGCTTVSDLKTVPAQRSAMLTISFRSGGRPGRIQQSVAVVTKEYPDRPFVISMTGQVVPVLTMNPPAIDLGVVRSSERRHFRSTLSKVDGKALHITIPNDTNRSIYKIVPQADRSTVELRGTIIVPSTAGNYEESIRLRLDDPLLPTVIVPVRFTVASEFSVQPAHLNFGIVPLRGVLQQNVRIRGQFPQSLRIVTAPPQVSAMLRCVNSGEYVLNARTTTTSRADLLSSQVVLATGNAKQPKIIVPVYAAFAR